MACHCLYLENAGDFYLLLKNRDSETMKKMVKCVLSASRRKKDNIDVFDITFADQSSMQFSIEKKEYKTFMKNTLEDMIKIEEYELCAQMKKFINQKERKPKNGADKAQTQM